MLIHILRMHQICLLGTEISFWTYKNVDGQMHGRCQNYTSPTWSRENKAEYWFSCMTHRLIVLYNCMKFHSNRCNGFQLTKRTRNSTANNVRVITPKINKAKLLFSRMTHRLIVLYNCMKFHSNSCKGFQLTEQTHSNSCKGFQLTEQTHSNSCKGFQLT